MVQGGNMDQLKNKRHGQIASFDVGSVNKVKSGSMEANAYGRYSVICLVMMCAEFVTLGIFF